MSSLGAIGGRRCRTEVVVMLGLSWSAHLGLLLAVLGDVLRQEHSRDLNALVS